MRSFFGAAFALLAAAAGIAQTTITALPTPPTRSDPANFAARADAFLGALPTFATQLNAVASQTQAAAASAVNAPGTSATSATSMTVGSGSRSFTIQPGKAFTLGQFVQVAAAGAVANYMNGQITAYDAGSGAMTVAVGYSAGSGTYSNWWVALGTPVNPGAFVSKGAGAGQTASAVSIGWSGARLKAQVDATDLGPFVFDAQLSAALAGYQPALGFTPYNASNPAGFISGINGGMVTGALGYTPANKAGDSFSGDLSGQNLTARGNLGVGGNVTVGGASTFSGGVNGFLNSNAGAQFAGTIAREAQFYLDLSGGDPIIVVKGSSYLKYRRSTDTWLFVTNGVAVATLDGGGNLTLRGGVYANGNPN